MEKTVSEVVTCNLEELKPVTTFLEIILVTGNQLPLILKTPKTGNRILHKWFHALN